MSISWEPYVWDAPHPVAPGELETLERQWGVSLPSGYRSIVSIYQGMTPNPHIIDIGRGDSSICAFLTISEDELSRVYAIRDAHNLMKPHTPPGIYPFALTGSGEYVCFDYRAAPIQPRIIFVTVEMDIFPIANSFSEFLEKLHD